MDLAQRVMNHELIAISNGYRTVDGQGLLLSYTEIHPQGDQEAFLTADTEMSCDQSMLQRYYLAVSLDTKTVAYLRAIA